jgi:hypothetical protein
MRDTVRTSGESFGRPATVVAAGVALTLLFALAGPALAAGAAQGTDLWGGPGAKGAGLSAHFDTTVFVTGAFAASGTVEYWVGGAVVDSAAFSIPARGTAAVATPSTLDGLGAFLIRVRADVPVGAWSETYNETPGGRFGLAIPAFGPADFLNPGDEATGGGASASSDPAASRTNVGVLCSGNGTQPCQAEVSVYDAGTFLGAGTLSGSPGSASQQSLAALVPAAAGKTVLTLRFRVVAGASQPYAILNDNGTSDASLLPLAVTRGAFSTAPVITSYVLSPTSGCAPLPVTATWTTTGAVKVSLSGVSGDLPPSGSKTFNVNATGDLVLTAYAASGISSSQTLRVTLTAPADPPTPSPSTATVVVGKKVNGLLPPTIGTVTYAFAQQQSTGSTFSILYNQFVYTAGSVAGTDVVTLTTTGPCGDVTSTFTATVTATPPPPGKPVIVSFTAEPPEGCAPANVLLSWTTQNVVAVDLPGVPTLGPLPANGAVPVTLNIPTTFTLTAYNAAGASVSTTLLVPVDLTAYTPIIDPAVNNQIWAENASILVTVTGVPDPSRLRIVTSKNESGGSFSPVGPGLYVYQAGPNPGQDVYRVFYTNGCGNAYGEFKATVVP